MAPDKKTMTIRPIPPQSLRHSEPLPIALAGKVAVAAFGSQWPLGRLHVPASTPC